MNIKDMYLHGGSNIVKNITFSIPSSGTNSGKLVATITWAKEGAEPTTTAIPINTSIFGSVTKNTVLAGPNGSNGNPSFRALVAADIPDLAASKIASGVFDAARLPLASNSAKGAIILGIALTSDLDSAITGKKYWVKMNANGKLFVDVPWANNTHYTAIPILGGSTATSNATSDTANDATYLNIIENSAKSGGILITGSGATTVKANAGKLTINSTNTWKAANNSQEGYVPKLVSGGTSLSDSTNDYILAFTYADGTLTPSWKKLPANAYLNNTYTVNNATYSIKSKIGDTTTTLSDFTANQSAADDFTLILGSNITFTNDATNRTLTIAGTPNTTYKLTLNGTVKGTTGGTDLGTFYAIATSDTSTANQVWMRNSSNKGYGWRTLGSRAFDSTAYVPTSGGTISNNDFAPFFIQRNHTTNAAAMGFKHYSSGTTVEVMGYIGMSEKDGALKRWDGAISTAYTILDSSNSSVSKSGETLTVKINGTSQSLTNTWRGIQNNLTSDSTTDSLSAAQGKALANGSARDNTKVLLNSGTAEQTIKSSIGSLGIGVIQLWRATSGGYAMIGFANGTTKTNLGLIGFSAANTLIFRNTSGTDYSIAHANNITDKAATITSSSTTLATIAGKNITAKLPTNAKDTAGIVSGPGAAGKVYISNSSGTPTWDTFDTTVTSGSSHLVTSGAVYTAIANNVASAVQYQGTIDSEADMIALTNAGQGDFARVTTAFTFTDASGASVKAHVGDVVYLTNDTPGTAANWIVAHTEIDTNTWTAASTSAAGYVPKLTTKGANLAAASTDYVLAFTNGATSPSWLKLPANAYKNDNTTGIKLKTTDGAPGTTKIINDTVISVGSSTGLLIKGGTNKFLIGNGTNYIEVGVAHGLSTKNININGTNYALYTSASSLPTIKAPTAFGSANLILATNADANGLTWVNKPATNVTTSLYVGASNGTATAAQTAGNVHLILQEGDTYTRYNITGSGRASVTSDASGTITINSAGYSNFVKSGSNAAAGLVPSPGTTAGTGKFLCEDGTWKTPSYTTNTDKTGIKLATVSGAKKTDGTVIITNSSTGLSITGGTNKFSIGDGTNYIEVAVTPSITNNVTGSGTSGKLVKWSGTNAITDGPALSSAISSLSLTTKFLREDGTWAAPSYTTDTVRPIYTGGTSRFTNSQKTAINFVGAGATSVTFLAEGTGEGQSGNASYASIKISSNNDLVKFSAITANTEYYLPVRAKNTTDTAQLLYRTSIIVKDSTITATLSGNATTATDLKETNMRGWLYQNGDASTNGTGVGTRATTGDNSIGIPIIHHTSSSNDTYVLMKALFRKTLADSVAASSIYIGDSIRSNKFACVKSKDSTTDDWNGSSTSGSSGSGSTTYSAGDGISISNGVISSTKKEWYGTEALFNSLASLDSNTTYYIMN